VRRSVQSCVVHCAAQQTCRDPHARPERRPATWAEVVGAARETWCRRGGATSESGGRHRSRQSGVGVLLDWTASFAHAVQSRPIVGLRKETKQSQSPRAAVPVRLEPKVDAGAWDTERAGQRRTGQQWQVRSITGSWGVPGQRARVPTTPQGPGLGTRVQFRPSGGTRMPVRRPDLHLAPECTGSPLRPREDPANDGFRLRKTSPGRVPASPCRAAG
jgi:hypothetical protein